ncbi:MAG: hypothetical protein WCP29_02655 [Acidobacteriota bacterium]
MPKAKVQAQLAKQGVDATAPPQTDASSDISSIDLSVKAPPGK